MALQDALGTVGDPITRAISSTFGKSNETMPTLSPEQGMQRRIARGAAAEEQLPGLLESSMAEATKAQEDIAKKRTGMAERGKAIGEEFAVKERELVEAPEYKQKEIPAFEPSSANLEDIRNVLGLSIVAGFLVGGASKRSGMAAMAALNGAVEGFRQGRQDVYKREIDVFAKNVEAIKENNRQTLERFNRAMSLLQTDRKAAEGELKVLEAEVQNSVAAAALRQGQYTQARDALFKAVEGSDRASQTMLQLKQQAELRREQMQLQAQLQRDKAELQAAIAANKPLQLPSDLAKTYENIGETAQAIRRTVSTFKPEFFGVIPNATVARTFMSFVERGLPAGEIVSNIASTFGANLPKITPQTVDWWKNYDAFVAQVRNKLFGATLTNREQADFEKFTISPATSPEQAAMFFQRQVDIINGARDRERNKGLTRRVSPDVIDAYLGETLSFGQPGQSRQTPRGKGTPDDPIRLD